MNKNVLYLSHGGGPLPLLGDKGHTEMVNSLKEISSKIVKPSAIIVISAHWEEDIPTITSGGNPSLIYDYYGFPEESYDIKYPAPGDPVLAQKLFSLLNDKGIKAELNVERGFDHGMFIPLKIMYPEANIPCIQLSLKNNMSPKEHIRIGEILSEIEHENLLVIGSGMSFHNMNAFFDTTDSQSKFKNESFEEWLMDTISNGEIDETERTTLLENWEKAPSARYCHPREEHLLPLHVCYGVAKCSCKEIFKIKILGKKVSMYLW